MKLDLQSFDLFYSVSEEDGTITDIELSTDNYYVFLDIPADCAIRLSQEQYDSVKGSNTWAGRTWGRILSPNDEF